MSSSPEDPKSTDSRSSIDIVCVRKEDLVWAFEVIDSAIDAWSALYAGGADRDIVMEFSGDRQRYHRLKTAINR